MKAFRTSVAIIIALLCCVAATANDFEVYGIYYNISGNYNVTVTYKGKTASTEQELVQMKYTLDEDTDYEVSIDYDSEGFVSNINIMTIDEVLNKQ